METREIEFCKSLILRVGKYKAVRMQSVRLWKKYLLSSTFHASQSGLDNSFSYAGQKGVLAVVVEISRPILFMF